MAERLFELPETKGQFQLSGIVSGTESSRFFDERALKSNPNKMMRMVNFGVDYNFDKRLFINMVGIEQDNVYFYSRDKKETKRIGWANRFNFNDDSYRLIGVNIGVDRRTDPMTGEQENNKKVLTDYDACEEVKLFLKDGQSVFLRGDLNFRSYINRNGDKISSISLVPKQISRMNDLDFTNEEYKERSDFNQVIVFMGINHEKDDNGKSTGRFIVEAKIVTYSTIEDAEFIIKDAKLASMFRKNLKPYNSIKVSGHMIVELETDEVEDEDSWGEADAMERISTPVRREFVITGAKGNTIDRDTYSEENINAAIVAINNSKKAEKDFNASNDDLNDDWGEASLDDDDDLDW